MIGYGAAAIVCMIVGITRPSILQRRMMWMTMERQAVNGSEVTSVTSTVQTLVLDLLVVTYVGNLGYKHW